MSGANASPIGRSHQEKGGANASPIGPSHQEKARRTASWFLVTSSLAKATFWSCTNEKHHQNCISHFHHYCRARIRHAGVETIASRNIAASRSQLGILADLFGGACANSGARESERGREEQHRHPSTLLARSR